MSISLVSPWYEPRVYRSLHFTIISGKDAALDAAHSLKTDTDSKLYGMGVSLGGYHDDAFHFIQSAGYFRISSLSFWLLNENVWTRWVQSRRRTRGQLKIFRFVSFPDFYLYHCIFLGKNANFTGRVESKEKAEARVMVRVQPSEIKVTRCWKHRSSHPTLPPFHPEILSCECLRSWSLSSYL